MLSRRISLSLITIFLAIPLLVHVPQSYAHPSEGGWTFYQEYRGSVNTFGQTTVLDLSAGYNVNKYFGVDVGIPLHFVHREYDNRAVFAPLHAWNTNVGDAYLNLRFNYPNRTVNYASQVRTFAPTGDYGDGFSTGRVTVDWNNRLDRAFGRVTPFFEAGLGSTVGDRHYFVRPYRTLGLVSQMEGGADVKIASNLYAGGSWYGVIPSGTQKIYSQLINQSPGSVAFPISHFRYFTSAFLTQGPSSIVKDNGLSGWVGIKTGRNVDLEIGYSRSTRMDLDTVSFRVGFNAGALVRRITSRL